MSLDSALKSKKPTDLLQDYRQLNKFFADKYKIKLNPNMFQGRFSRDTRQPQKKTRKFSAENITNKFVAKYAGQGGLAGGSKNNSNDVRPTTSNYPSFLVNQPKPQPVLNVKSKLTAFEFHHPAEKMRKFSSMNELSQQSYDDDGFAEPEKPIFKMPAVPRLKKFQSQFQLRMDRSQENNESFQSPADSLFNLMKSNEKPRGGRAVTFDDTADMTLATITSGQFNPPKASTPVERGERAGIIIDPDDMTTDVSMIELD